jgi:hypothetical protein
MTTNPYLSPEEQGHIPPSKPKASSSLLSWLIVLSILVLLAALLLPNYRGGAPRGAARRMQCSNHLKQIALALQNYHDTYGSFPPAYISDENGKPLHSWRALILPFAEHKPLYDQLDLTKPWDDPANRAIYDAAPAYFNCPSSTLARGLTTYLAVATTDGCFAGDQPRAVSAITDHHDFTLLVVEVPEKYAVHWMEPRDLDDALLAKLTKEDKRSHVGGTQASSVSGRTMFLRADLDSATLHALLTIAGKDDRVAQAAE